MYHVLSYLSFSLLLYKIVSPRILYLRKFTSMHHVQDLAVLYMYKTINQHSSVI